MLDKKVILVGYSGHGLVVAEAAFESEINVVGYIDVEKKNSNPFYLEFLGSEYTLKDDFFNEPYRFIVGIGDIKLRKKIADSIFSKGGKFIKIVHPSSSISKSAILGNGSFVSKNVAINSFASIGENCIINTGSIIEHECLLGENVHIAPGAVLTGGVIVGDNSFIGANSVIKQNVNIGKNVVIGAGAVIINNVKDNKIIVGNPGKEI